jgi:hypothetical protein
LAADEAVRDGGVDGAPAVKENAADGDGVSELVRESEGDVPAGAAVAD